LSARQILCGSGTVNGKMKFIFSQRSLFLVNERGNGSTSKRSIINTRNEPWADDKLFGRLHVIAGDSNMSEWSIYLKIGTTHLILLALEKLLRYAMNRNWKQFIACLPIHLVECDFDTVSLLRSINMDTSFLSRYPFDGKRISVFDIHESLLEFVEKTVGDYLSAEENLILKTWRKFVEKIKQNDQDFLASHLDWAIKKRTMECKLERGKLDPKILAGNGASCNNFALFCIS